MSGPDPDGAGTPASQEVLDSMVAAADTGARQPGPATAKIIFAVALAWSVFQLWYASPLPFMFARFLPVLNDTEARSIHLAFAVFLAFMSFPALSRSPRHHVPVTDWVLACLAALTASYLFVFYAQLAERPGRPTTPDLAVAAVGMVLLLEATRRSLGPPLMIVAMVFLSYVFFGHLAPDVIAWKGASFSKGMSHQWLTTEGVFGVALGVSTSFVFLFVLFGALLDKAGAGNYFIKVAFALLGHLRGGPAKAAVLSSGLTGLISGSSIANVVTTGTFTIPLMKRVGFSAEKAGAVEVASSVNGQIMPPVMGAAAFLMVEYVGIPYIDVIRHAFLPAIISYIALLYIVHLEALKSGMQGLSKPQSGHSMMMRLVRSGIVVTSVLVIAGASYYAVLGIRFVLGGASVGGLIALLAAVYLLLLWIAAREDDLEVDDPNAPVLSLPMVWPTVRTGLHFILPIVVLVWALMVERLSPGLSAFWATTVMIATLLTQRPLINFFRGAGAYDAAIRRGFGDLIDGLATGARNMIGIGVATATAGIIVGAVSLTGIGQVMTEFVELISGGNLLAMLFFVAVISLILGMGLPTTANYIVVSSLMAGVIVELGAQNGLVVPLIAVHLFVFYFGIMADVTPPVGLASFAAAAVSGADPMRTGFTAFFYSLRTVILPFLFIFNTKLLLIGIEGPVDFILTIFGSVVAVLIFAAATQGYFQAKSRLWESLVLLVVALALFRPGFFLDMVEAPYQTLSLAEARQIIPAAPEGGDVRLVVEGEDLDGDFIRKTILLPLGPVGAFEDRLAFAGLELREEGADVIVDNVAFASPAERMGVDFDWKIPSIEIPAERASKYWFYIPTLLVLGGIVAIQRRRRDAPGRETGD